VSTRGSKPSLARAGVDLRLYVAGDAPNSTAAQENLRVFLARYPGALFRLEIVDVLKEPDRGMRDGVVVTPMLLKVTPKPARRVVGNLRDESMLLSVLDLEKLPRE